MLTTLSWLARAGVVVLAAAVAWDLGTARPAVVVPSQAGGRSGVEQVWVEVRPRAPVRYVPQYGDGPRLTARAALLLEPETMTVLYAHNEHERRAPASTTKIMTALLALERGRPGATVTVSRRAAAVPGSTAQLRVGQRVSFENLLHGLLLRSGNDAATALAEHIAGSELDFVRMMNQRAAELGLENTQFQNPHGLDRKGHHSTAFDLALLARTALLLPSFTELVSRRTYSPQAGVEWRNTNRLLWSFEGAEGVKTGTTSQAGYCLVAAASREGMRLISVVLGSDNRWLDSARLLEYGFGEYNLLTLAGRGEVLAEAAVPGGLVQLTAVAGEDMRVAVRNEEVNRLRVRVRLTRLNPPLAAGEEVGELQIFTGGAAPAWTVPLVAVGDVPRWSPLRAFWRWLRNL